MTFVGAFDRRPPGEVEAEVRGLADKWWIVALLGLGISVLGLILLLDLFTAVATLAILVALGLVVEGVDEIMEAGRHRVRWPGYLLGGLWIATGVIAVVWPDITLWALALLAGAALLTAGLLRMVMALYNRDDPNWTLDLSIGGFGVALGAVVLAWPDATLVVLALSLGIRAIVTGLIAIGTGWQMHRLAT